MCPAAYSICLACGSGELACQNVNGLGGETFTLTNVSQTTYIWVDGTTTHGLSEQGSYALVLAP